MALVNLVREQYHESSSALHVTPLVIPPKMPDPPMPPFERPEEEEDDLFPMIFYFIPVLFLMWIDRKVNYIHCCLEKKNN